MNISLGIITCRDRENLPGLLRCISSQRLRKVKIAEIFIVAPDEDEGYIKQVIEVSGELEKKIHFVNEGMRKGKYAAVNLFLKKAKSDVLVLCSGDVTLEENAIERLCAPLEDPRVGIVASRPVPTGSGRDRKLDETVRLIWELHHAISRSTPKFGELMAFRNLHFQIPRTAVDEEMIASLTLSRGYGGVYASEALAYNKGTRGVADYIRQRRRIYCGHLALKRVQGYTTPTVNNISVLRCLMSDKSLQRPSLSGLAYAALLEGFSRLLGTVDFIRGVDHSRWKIVQKG